MRQAEWRKNSIDVDTTLDVKRLLYNVSWGLESAVGCAVSNLESVAKMSMKPGHESVHYLH